MKKSKNSKKMLETPARIAVSPESSNVSVDQVESAAAPTGASLIKRFKNEGMSVKDAFAAATKLNSAIKESSFKAGWYKKDVPSSAKKASRGRKPGSKNKIKIVNPVKAGAVSTAKASNPVKTSVVKSTVRTSTSTLSAGTKKLVVDALRAQIVELETAIKELGR